MRQIFTSIVLLFFVNFICNGQTCPENIDFEQGTFNKWQCLDGRISLSDATTGGPVNIAIINTQPIVGRHEIISPTSTIQKDFYGDFPTLAPNGSNYSVKIGNEERGGLITGVQYKMKIPVNENRFYLQYNYAVVYESPNHQLDYQPRFEIIVRDIDNDEIIDCSTLIFYAGGSQQGFQVSDKKHNGITVLYKDWAPSTLFLKNMGGRNIEVTFRVTGCAYAEHFGYAYLDVNSNCSERFPGSSFCKDDTAINVQGLSGYEKYKWFKSDFSQVLSTTKNLIVNPAPANGTVYALETVPFYKPNCKDTFFVTVTDTLLVQANAGRDTSYCVGQKIRIGSEAKDGITYRWSPGTAMSDSTISNPIVSPIGPTKYTLTASSFGGGCIETDEVWVSPFSINTKLQLVGKDSVCLNRDPNTILVANVSDSVVWYRDSTKVISFTGNSLVASQSGKYYAQIFTKQGCSYYTDTLSLYVEPAIAGIRYPTRNLITGFNFQLEARQLGVTYLWKASGFLSDSKIFNPIISPGTAPVDYLIDITTAGGCVITDSLSVKVFPKVAIYVPSAFTPNGDGLNDYLKPNLRGIAKLDFFRIYNRYGQVVYSYSENDKGWDGRIKSAGQGNNMFVWIAQGLGVDGKVYKEKGSIMLLR